MGRPRLGKKPQQKPRLIQVTDPEGNIVYEGRERRGHRETVFFASTEGESRRFTLDGKIKLARIKELRKIGRKKFMLNMMTRPSGRSTKNKVTAR